MSSTFFGLNVALSGVTTQQRALNTVSHNLTNATTPGFSRQRVQTSAATPFAYPGLNTAVGPGQLGTGVVATQYARMRDQFADLSYRGGTSDLGQFKAKSDALSNIDTIIDEPGDTGLTSLLSKSVRQSPQGTYAWRRHGAGPPERVTIVLGARQSDVAEVRSGLARGDSVLTGGFPDAK